MGVNFGLGIARDVAAQAATTRPGYFGEFPSKLQIAVHTPPVSLIDSLWCQLVSQDFWVGLLSICTHDPDGSILPWVCIWSTDVIIVEVRTGSRARVSGG